MSTDAVDASPSAAATSPIISKKPPERGGVHTPPSKQSLAKRMRTDTCFKCKKQGHWARDCPNTTTQKALSCTQLFAKQDSDFPVVMCPLGHASCSVQTSSSEKNPNRKYYECPLKRTGGCDFFKWHDEMCLPEFVPVCDCGAGKCCVDRVKVGPNVGRWLFTCRVRKGHGACQFFQWEYAESHAPTNQSIDNNGELAKNVSNGSERGANSSSQPAKKLRTESSIMQNHHLSSAAASSTVARSLDFSVVHETTQEDAGEPPSRRAVRSLQNDLCSVLELNFANDPEFMERVVNPILDALDHLSPDNKPFREHVGEFIRCASSLAQFEQPVCNEPTLQDVVNRHSIEKGKLDDISVKHSEAMDAFNASKDEVSCLKETLVRIKNKLSCCEVEMEKLKACADEICEEKAECERNVQVAEEALRRARKREEERLAAKEAFEKARNKLRQGV